LSFGTKIRCGVIRNGKKILKSSATDTVNSSPSPRLDIQHTEPAALGFKFYASGTGSLPA
jgi:hypothetical protein